MFRCYPLPYSASHAVAMNLSKGIGQASMVKYSINDWIICQSNDGNVVERKEGLIICQNISNVATACSVLINCGGEKLDQYSLFLR